MIFRLLAIVTLYSMSMSMVDMTESSGSDNIHTQSGDIIGLQLKSVEQFEYHEHTHEGKYSNYIAPLFMTRDPRFSSRLNIQVYGLHIDEDVDLDFTCLPLENDTFCKDLHKTHAHIESNERWVKDFQDIEGPSTTGYHMGLLHISASVPIQMRINSRLSDDCVSIYTHNAVEGVGLKTKSVVPIIGPESFLAIIPQVITDEVIDVNVTMRGLTAKEWENVKRKNINNRNNPFKDGEKGNIALNSNQTYMFVLRDFPELKNATGILIEPSANIGVYTGSSDRREDPGHRGCTRGHAIEPVIVGPEPHDQRYFLAHKHQFDEDRNATTHVYVSSLNHRTDVEVTIGDEGNSNWRAIRQINKSGESLKLLLQTDTIKLVARTKVVVLLSTRLVTGDTADVSVVQLVSLDQYINHFYMRNGHLEYDDHHFHLLMQSHKYLAAHHVRANEEFFINGLSLPDALNEGWITKTEMAHPIFTSYSTVRLKLLSRKTIQERMFHFTGKKHNYTKPLYLNISSKIPFMIEFSVQHTEKTITLFNVRPKLVKDIVCSYSYPYLDDGRDNDCDGLLDEDMFGNGIDDDGDGLEDEDPSLTNYWEEAKACTQWTSFCSSNCRGIGQITEERECLQQPSVMMGDEHGVHRTSVKCDTTMKPCNTECDQGYWGEECKRHCPETCSLHGYCYKDNGACVRCPSGFGGETCNEMCPEGMFGPFCSKNCSTFCENGKCHPVNGNCDADDISNWAYAMVASYLLMIPSAAILLHAVVFFAKNRSRMWQFRDPLGEYRRSKGDL